MAEYITKIRTEKGDMEIDYNTLANKPESLPANGGNSDTVDGKHADYFAAATDLDKKAPSVHEHSADDITSGVLPILHGGHGAASAEEGLKNLFAAGNVILSSHQYGDQLPTAGVVGRLFLKRLVSS